MWLAAICACSFRHGVDPDAAATPDVPRDTVQMSCQGSAWVALGGAMYRDTSVLEDQNAAEQECVGYGGHLIKITDVATNSIAMSASQAAFNLMWIGLKNTNSTYYWTDGKALGSADYHNFQAGGIPIDTSRPCVVISSSGTWTLQDCFSPPSTYQGICQCP